MCDHRWKEVKMIESELTWRSTLGFVKFDWKHGWSRNSDWCWWRSWSSKGLFRSPVENNSIWIDQQICGGSGLTSNWFVFSQCSSNWSRPVSSVEVFLFSPLQSRPGEMTDEKDSEWCSRHRKRMSDAGNAKLSFCPVRSSPQRPCGKSDAVCMLVELLMQMRMTMGSSSWSMEPGRFGDCCPAKGLLKEWIQPEPRYRKAVVRNVTHGILFTNVDVNPAGFNWRHAKDTQVVSWIWTSPQEAMTSTIARESV